MASVRSQRPAASCPGRARGARGRGVLVAACAAPGAVSTPSAASAAAARRRLHRPAAAASVGSVGERRGRGPDCGTDPVELNAYFETGFDLPFKLSEEFTKQYPNVTWDISQDQFTNLMTATPRLLSGDNPPDLIRLPSMVSLVKDGLLKNLDGYATAFGWDKWPAAQLAQNRVADGRHPRLRLALRHGPQLQPDRCLLQQGAGRADRHDRAAQDASPSSRTCSPRRRRPDLLPIMAWNATASGGGLAFPLQNLMAAYGPTAADQRLDLPEAGRDHRHARPT